MRIIYEKYPFLKLNNGIGVCNFTSPHRYIFTTGETLAACSDHIANSMKLKGQHTGTGRVIINGGQESIAIPQKDVDNWKEYIIKGWPQYRNEVMWLDVSIDYKIPDKMLDDILAINEMDIVDIILVPYPVLNAWKSDTKMQDKVIAGSEIIPELDIVNDHQLALNKMRTCHLYDRVKKVIYNDRFCK
jgi:hypothetical protein